jgi:3-phosphoshikimate 1-carboxyvinyltransferase
MIDFKGSISSSKSLVNRALLLKQSFKDFKVNWKSEADDVIYFERAIENLDQPFFYVGEGGTTFRFLSVYLSSLKGEWIISAKPNLLKRPHQDLYDFFDSLNIEYELSGETLKIKTQGWNLSEGELSVSSVHTTQVISAVLLTALGFKKPFSIKTLSTQDSNYFLMTINFIRSLGVDCQINSDRIYVNNIEILEGSSLEIEGDWSSAAFLYVLGALNGKVEITNLKQGSIQPDSVILKFLKDAGVPVEDFKVSSKSHQDLIPQHLNLKESPDLFPVLSALLCFASGESRLFGAPQLIFKESNRISEVFKLLDMCGVKVNKTSDGIQIFGEGRAVKDHKSFDFDCSGDHRIFMCAYIMKFMGYKVNIKGEESIKKSFPDFFDLEKKHVFFNRS